LARVSGSRPGFFNIGLTIADLKASGTMPFTSEEFIATVIAGQIESMMVHRTGTGTGSAGEELRLLDLTSAHTALS
jgi:hypothetical protein